MAHVYSSPRYVFYGNGALEDASRNKRLEGRGGEGEREEEGGEGGGGKKRREK